MQQSSRLSNLIDQATSNDLSRPDSSLNTQVCTEINSRADLAKEAAKCLKKRFATKEPKVIALSLELLDLCMVKCGNPLHIQIGTKEFMNILVSLLNMKNMPKEIQNRVLILIQKWGIRFEKDRDILPLFSDVYKALKDRGVPFPEPSVSTQQQQSAQEGPKPTGPSRTQQRPSSRTRSSAAPEQKSTNKKIQPKYQKLLTDMNLVKGNINLTNQIIDSSKPSDLEREDNSINDLVRTLKDMEPKLFNLVATLEDEEMMKVCLLVNDDLHKTFARYEKLKKGKKPESFVPGESQQNTALVPTCIYEVGSLKPVAKQTGMQPGQLQPQPKPTQQQESAKPQATNQNVDLFDLMAGPSTTTTNVSNKQSSSLGEFDFFGGGSQAPQTQQIQSQPNNLGGFNTQQVPQQQQQQQPPQQQQLDPIAQLNQIMKNMQEMTDNNQSNNQAPGSGMGGMQNQFATNVMPGMGMGGPGMGMNPMMNQYMTGMPGMGMGMGMNMGMPGMGGFGGGNFATNMNPMMGGGLGFGGPPQNNFSTNMPSSGAGFGAPMGGGNFAAGPGPSADSFRKDGFNIMGKQPIKTVDEEGAKEFADLFNLADTKIKDRQKEKQQISYDYNPVASPQQNQTQSSASINQGFANMNLGQTANTQQQQQPVQQQQQQYSQHDSQHDSYHSGSNHQQQNQNDMFGGSGFGDFGQSNQKPADDMFGGFSMGGYNEQQHTSPQQHQEQQQTQQQQNQQQDIFDMFS